MRHVLISSPLFSALPEILEPRRRQLGIAHRMLDVPMPQVSLESSGIMPFVGQREPAGVPQHVRMSLEAQLGLDPGTFHKLGKPARAERRSALGREHERQFGVLLALQFP